MTDPEIEELTGQVAALRKRLAELEALQTAQTAEGNNAIAELEAELAPAQETGAPVTMQVDRVLLDSEALYQAIFDNAPIGIALVNMDGRTVAANGALQRMLGYHEGELVNSSPAAVSYPADEARDKGLTEQLLRGELPHYQMEKRYVRRDGSTMYARLTVSLIRNGLQPQYIVGLVEDITAEKETQQALEESQARFNMLTQSLDVLFWIFDVKQDREIYLSPALEKLWGLHPDTTLQRRELLLESIVPEDREIFLAAMQLMREGQPVTRTYRIVRADGAVRYIHGEGFPVHDETGSVPIIAGTGTDITEAVNTHERIRQLNETLEQQVQERTQKLADALVEIQEQRDFSHQITESMREGVVVYDGEGTIEYANPFVSELTGAPLEEIIGSKLQEWSQIFEAPAVAQEQVALRKTGKSADYEISVRNSAGQMRYLRVLSTARVRGGKYDGGIAVFSDLTQRRTMEMHLRLASERLAQANRELARAARMKDEFLANVSHELRTPLTGILALSEALLADTYGEVPQRQQRPLAMIEESGRHLLSLINDVLDVAKAEAGKLDIAPEPLSADDLCQASLRLVRDLANRKNQQVSCILEPPGLKLLGDPRRLKQVLVNLLSNAVKFTPQGGRLGIRVHADEQQHTVTFTVWDEGIGIPPDQLKRIFEPFVQVESESSRSYSGTGLGLTLVRRLAELHMGTVLVESEPSRGSQFHVILPWQMGQNIDEPSPPLLDAATSGTSSAITATVGLNGEAPATGVEVPDQAAWGQLPAVEPRVLLAEDNAVTRAALEEYLGQQGLQVLVAADGLEALELATTRRPDLVLMDIQMPKMDGLEAIRRIRALNDADAARVPIIALTAHAMPGDREQFLRAGANGYLSKPVRLAELRQQIAAYVPQLVE